MIACVYLPPSLCSDAFCNIHVDTTSNDSEKFLNCLETCNINQHVHKPTHLHGHILNLTLPPDDSSVVSNVRVSEFISDHVLLLGQLDFTNPSVPRSKNSQPRQEPQPAGTAKWPTTLRFGKIFGTTSVVRSIEHPQDVPQKIHRL